MSKSEERALEAFPLKIDGDSRGSYDLNLVKRIVYQQGYKQAEKDLELTLEDVKEIYCIALNLRDHVGSSVFGQPFYEEVLKRFNKERKEV